MPDRLTDFIIAFVAVLKEAIVYVVAVSNISDY
jgi:hypothetical protein